MRVDAAEASEYKKLALLKTVYLIIWRFKTKFL